MGLAAYGNPGVFRREFQSIMRVGKEDYAVDPEAIGFQSAKSSRKETLLGPPRDPHLEILPRHADIAAALQAATNAAVAALVRRLKRKVPLDNLCLAGGVALNCVTNEVVRQSGDFSMCSFPPRPMMLAPQSAQPLSCIALNRKAIRSAATRRHSSVPSSTGGKF